jgi:actin-related protein
LESDLLALRQSAKEEMVQLECECSQRQEAASRALEEKMQRCEEIRASLETHAALLKKTKEQPAKDHDECAFEKLQLPWRRNCNGVKKYVPPWKHTPLV